MLAWPAAHPRHIVLVVGDVAQTNQEVVTTLLAAGFDAVAVETGAATLALLESFHPCALVLDVLMPDMSAWQLWERVKRRSGDDPPAAVLLSSDLVDATRARVVDMREFVRKPVAVERLIDAVERHCPRRVARLMDGPAGGDLRSD
jgi:CheY-like chemotaxis protein